MTTDMNLLYETIAMLRQHIDASAEVALDAEESDEWLQDVVRLLHQYNMAASRKMHVLGCCVLLRQAVRSHRELALDDNEALTRGILGGDYLIGLYYRFGMKCKEWQLLLHLAPFHKKLQITMFERKPIGPVMQELGEKLRGYLDMHCA